MNDINLKQKASVNIFVMRVNSIIVKCKRVYVICDSVSVIFINTIKFNKKYYKKI